MKYRVIWNTDHDSGALPAVYTSKRAAERAGAEWKREMVAAETTAEGRAAARREYAWGIFDAVDGDGPH
jgi:hypothetical protein